MMYTVTIFAKRIRACCHVLYSQMTASPDVRCHCFELVSQWAWAFESSSRRWWTVFKSEHCDLIILFASPIDTRSNFRSWSEFSHAESQHERQRYCRKSLGIGGLACFVIALVTLVFIKRRRRPCQPEAVLKTVPFSSAGQTIMLEKAESHSQTPDVPATIGLLLPSAASGSLTTSSSQPAGRNRRFEGGDATNWYWSTTETCWLMNAHEVFVYFLPTIMSFLVLMINENS